MTGSGMTRAETRPGELLWTPSPERTKNSAMYRFLGQVCAEEGLPARYADLWQWSVEHPDRFWPRLAAFFGVRLPAFRTAAREIILALQPAGGEPSAATTGSKDS